MTIFLLFLLTLAILDLAGFARVVRRDRGRPPRHVERSWDSGALPSGPYRSL